MSGRDCFDCEYAEYDVEEYFGGYREKIVIGCNSPDECTEDKEKADRVRGNDMGDYPDVVQNQFDNMTGSMNL
ncbi:MAG: hypothetical protein K5886_02710 [Lachnospiraceae bacterium]|jgi:hypothetical protein|nr:hypothetical protein [Lachnospiraceae bacterium]